MATIVNARDVLLQGAATRVANVTSLPGLVISQAQVDGLGIVVDGTRMVILQATTQVFQIAKNGTVSPVNTTLTAQARNISGAMSLSVISGTITPAPTLSGGVVTIANTALITDTATIRLSATHGSTTYTDEITLVKVREGIDSLTGFLTNETHTLAADKLGNVLGYTGCSGTFKVFQGTTDVTTLCTFTLAPGGNPSSLTHTLGASTGAYSVTGGYPAGTDSTTMTFRATLGSVTLDKVFTITKTKAGADGAAGSNGSNGADGATAYGYYITADKQTFTYDGNAAAFPAGQIVTLKGVRQNVAATASWYVMDADGNPSPGITLGDHLHTYLGDTVLMTEARFTTARASTNGVKVKTLMPVTAWAVYQFATDAEGWVGGNATTSVSGGLLTVTSTAANSFISKTYAVGERPLGSDVKLVRVRCRRVSGTGTFEGNLYYSNVNHGATSSFYRKAPQPTATLGSYVFIDFDMTESLTNGDFADYTGNEITNFRVDIVNDGTDVWEVDYIILYKEVVTDTISIVKVQDGTNSVSGYLTNESHTIPANNAGSPTSFSGAGGTFKVFDGTVDKTGTAGPVTYTIQSNPSALTASISTAGVYSVTAKGSWPDASDSTTITFRAVYNGVTLDKVMTLSKATAGAAGTNGSNGQRGSRTWYVALGGATATYSDSLATTTASADGGPILNDTVTQYNNSQNFSQTKFWNGTAWVVVNAVVDGNLLVSGTVGAAHMVTNLFQSDNVLTRNMTIRDASGNILFSSGTNLDWTRVGGSGKPADGATSDLKLVAGGTCTVTGNSGSKTSGASAFDSQVYSLDSYTGGAYCSCTAGATKKAVMWGLNTDPTTDAGITGLDYAFYFTNTAGDDVQIYESNANRGVFTTYTPGDVFAITYDGVNVRYLKNGVVLRTVAATITNPLFFDSSFFHVGGTLNNIRFGPMSSSAWGSIGGTGKPADNATVGATFGVDINGQINAANVSTYIANAAIQDAQIGNVIKSSNFNGTVNASGVITSGGTAGWCLGKGGDLVANTGAFRGDITGASGTFSGALSAGAGKFAVDTSGNVTIASSTGTAARMTLANNVIKVFDGVNSAPRVQIGDLSA